MGFHGSHGSLDHPAGVSSSWKWATADRSGMKIEVKMTGINVVIGVRMVPMWTGVPANVHPGPRADEVQMDSVPHGTEVSSDSHSAGAGSSGSLFITDRQAGVGSLRKWATADGGPAGVSSSQNRTTMDRGPTGVSFSWNQAPVDRSLAGVGSSWNQTTMDGGPTGVSFSWNRATVDKGPAGASSSWNLTTVDRPAGVGSWGDWTTTDKHSGTASSRNRSSKSEGSAGASSLGDQTIANRTSVPGTFPSRREDSIGRQVQLHSFFELPDYRRQ